jgi:hypothetical protein
VVARADGRNLDLERSKFRSRIAVASPLLGVRAPADYLWRSREVDLAGRLSAESFVGPVLIVPIDGTSHFSLEFSLLFGDRDQSQNLL